METEHEKGVQQEQALTLPWLCRGINGALAETDGYFATVTGTGEVNRPTWSIKKQMLRTVSGNKKIWTSKLEMGGEGYSP